MRKTLQIMALLASVSMISACNLNEPTWVNTQRVEVLEEGFTDTYSTSDLNDGMLRAIGVNYYRYGNGPMDIAVSYDPQSKTNNEAQAKSEAKRIQDELTRNGVRNIRVTTTAAEKTGEASSTLISFPALTARAPDSCGMMPGYSSTHTDLPDTASGEAPSNRYHLGCTVESLMAKQVARPGDLLGRPGFETNADARRQEAVVWQRGYYANKSFDPLQGEIASDDQ